MSMTFAASIRTCFRKFATFSGRASRSEFWWFVLFLLIAGAAVSLVDAAIFGPQVSSTDFVSYHADGSTSQGSEQVIEYGSGPLSNLWSLVTLLPWLAAAWRRLHDSGRPGWYVLLPWAFLLAVALVMLTSLGIFSVGIGSPQELMERVQSFGMGSFAAIFLLGWLLTFGSFIALIVWLCRPSDPGPNRFGPPPDGVVHSEVPA
jgi:uncharacterized membrane protein YhaH (DUF805 family)